MNDAARTDPGPLRKRIPALPQELLDALAEHGIERRYRKGSIIVVEGEPAEAMYLVREGDLQVYLEDESGRHAELNRLGPGEYFGELMVAGEVRTASVVALTPVRLCMVRRPEFERMLAGRPDLAFHLIQTLIHRLSSLTERMRGHALLDVYGRMVRLFDDVAVAAAGQPAVVPLSQQAIAERVGASRAMVNRIVQDLERGGYIACARGRIELLKALPKRW
jgi:CRP/FNR family transcriptional regulator, cyclic AMP receptor protein